MHLLQETDTQAMLTSRQLQGLVEEALESAQLSDAYPSTAPPALHYALSYDELLDSHSSLNVDDVPPSARFLGGHSRNVVIMHSSGTTGTPSHLSNFPLPYFQESLHDNYRTSEADLPLALLPPRICCLPPSLRKRCRRCSERFDSTAVPWLRAARTLPRAFSWNACGPLRRNNYPYRAIRGYVASLSRCDFAHDCALYY